MLYEAIFEFSNRYYMSPLYESTKIKKACLKNNISES